MTKYEKLLKSWCDKLVEYMITEIKDPNFYGGIMCPACSMIHGRIGDAVYPFTLMYDITRDENYLNAAKMVIDWSEYNIKRKDGSYYNDKCTNWKGISVFSAVSIGLALLYHGACLDTETKEKWYKIFVRISEFVYVHFDLPTTKANINYYAAVCDVMAFAYRLTGDEKYKIKAYQKFDYVKSFFTKSGLLTGEGYGQKTEKDCKYIDLGYNVEESLPAIASFGHLMNDEKVLAFAADKFLSHIEFMLPDGAWDNSWGTRANKWTYWGSRTSDGAALGLCLLTDCNPIFSEAVERNYCLLERCTHDGLLYGGLMYKEHGEDACVHHTFCHAKSLAVMIDTKFSYKNSVALPRDTAYGVKYLDEINVNLISIGRLRATITDTDACLKDGRAVTGGTVSVLYSMNAGMLLSAVVPDYKESFSEPRNMQLSRTSDCIENCAMRISYGKFESVNDKNAIVSVESSDGKITVKVYGTLRDIHFCGKTGYKFTYVFDESSLQIKAECDEDAELLIPLISSYSDRIEKSQNKITVTKPKAVVAIESENGELTLPMGEAFRNITLVGGFMYVPIKADMKRGVPLTVKISL